MMNFFKKQSKTQSADEQALKYWYKDNYESVVIQRNFLFIAIFIAVITILVSISLIRFIKNTVSVEPFVIEIENKTGIPTVVEPVTLIEYSSNEAIKRYFIMKYINAREGYTRGSFLYDYNDVVRVLSDPSVYYGEYKSQFSPYSKTSPYVMYSDKYTREVFLKSMLFVTPKAVQVRVKITESGGTTAAAGDKLIYMEFDFTNLVMNEDERLINPLGFVVTLYRITNEVIEAGLSDNTAAKPATDNSSETQSTNTNQTKDAKTQ